MPIRCRSAAQHKCDRISLESAERQALHQVIEQNHWNVTLVAAQFKISRNTLYRKIKRHGIPIAHRSDGI